MEFILAVSITETDDPETGRIYVSRRCAALLFAVGLPSVEIARQARMYSMMQAWILAQVIFLLRARRLGGLANYAGLTIFSAIAVATNFTAALVIRAEVLWLIYLPCLCAKRRDDRDVRRMADGGRALRRDGIAAAVFCRFAIRRRGRAARRLRLDQAAGSMGTDSPRLKADSAPDHFRCLRCSQFLAGFAFGAPIAMRHAADPLDRGAADCPFAGSYLLLRCS